MQINIEYDPDVANAPAGFQTAVQQAVSYLDNLIANPITVTIEFGWGASGPINANQPNVGALSQPWWTGYASNLPSQVDPIITALESAYAANGLSAYVTPQVLAADFTDAAGPNNNIQVNVAEALALGLSGAQDTVQYVALNSTQNWNFDLNNQTNPDYLDAVAALLHEITHDLGRASGWAENPTIFDMFRYTAGGQLQLAPGGGQFSLNGSVLTLPFEPANLDPADWAGSVPNDANGYVPFGVGYDYSTTDILELKALGYQINAPAGDAPTVSTSNVAIAPNASTPATSFFSVFDPLLDNITSYQFMDAGSGTGHLALGGVAQADGQAFVVSAAQLGSVTYVGGSGPGSDTLYVSAYDSTTASWTAQAQLTATTTSGATAAVNLHALPAAENSPLSAWWLIASISNPNSHDLTLYQFEDLGTNGHFTLNGVAQPNGQPFTVSLADLGQVQYVGGAAAGSETLQVAVYDSTLGAWSPASQIDEATVAPPYPALHNIDINEGATATLAGPRTAEVFLPSIYVNGDAVTQYRFEDVGGGGGHLTVNGAAQADNQWVTVDVADLASVAYVGGAAPGADTLLVEVYDQATASWSAAASGSITTVANGHLDPSLALQNISAAEGGSVSGSAMIAGLANPSGDAITEYRFQTFGSDNGQLVFDGGAQPTSQWVVVGANQLNVVNWQAGASVGTQNIAVEAYDSATSSWTPFATLVAMTTGGAAAPPTVTAHDVSTDLNAGVAATSMFSLTNPSGDNITEYAFDDLGLGNGYFTVNGVAQAVGQAFAVATSDLGTVQYIGGAGPGVASFAVQAYDATTGSWTAASFATAATATTPTLVAVSESPSSGVLETGQTITFTLSFNEAVTVSGAPALGLNDGGVATYAGGAGSSALTFSYTVGASDTNVASLAASAVALNGGAIQDAQGDAASLSLTGISQTGPSIDTTGAKVVAMMAAPSGGPLAAGATVTIALDFNEAVTVNGAPTLALANGGVATLASGSGGHVLVFDYTVGASGASSLASLDPTALHLNGGAVDDTLGGAVNLTLPLTADGYAAFVTGVGSGALTGSGNDVFFVGNGGGETINPGPGVNTAVFTGSVEQYTVASAGTVVTVSDTVAGRDGTDTLNGVQQAEFSDVTVVFDLHSTQDLLVYELYQAAYDRTPDNAGFRYWADVADATGASALALADQFLAAPEFTLKYGSGLSNLQYVTELYSNVLGRQPDQAGLTYWVGQANAGQPRDQLLIDFATSQENANLIGSHIDHGYWTTH